jgi:hypothetical protein
LGGSNVDYYVEADLEHEVARDINECLVHVLARVKNTELWQKGQDTMQQVRVPIDNLRAMIFDELKPKK